MGKNNREENQPQQVLSVEEKTVDKRLAEAARSGDKAAFSRLIRRHQKRLFRFIYGLTGNFDMTEDIVQEAFVKAYNAIQSFKTDYEFYPWLATIARNTAYNMIHREERKESLNSLQEKGYNPETGELGPMEQLLDKESQQRFFKAVLALPPTYRTVFVLRHFEDMDYSEIASYLKIPPGTVNSRLYRARKLLTEALEDLL